MKQRESEFDTIALDIGSVRVGLALGSSLNGYISGLETVPRAQKQAERRVLALIAQYNLSTVVVGIPLDESGKKTEQSVISSQFAERIQKRASVKIVMVDEWGSSIAAKQRLNISGTPDKELRKTGLIDAESASIILESFFRGNQR